MRLRALRRVVVLLALLAGCPRLVAAADGGVKLQLRAGRPVVEGVYINGHGPFRFLVDTGATLNHLDPGLSWAADVSITFHTPLVSSTGTTPASGSEGNEIRLGPVTADGQTFLFGGIDALHQISPDLHGVLGQAFLSRFDYLLDLKSGRLEFGPAVARPTGTRAAFTHRADGRAVVSTSLGRLVLDSGAHAMIRFRVPMTGTHHMVTAAGTALVGTIPSTLVIGGRLLWRGEAVALADSPETDADGLLPLSAFRSVYFNNSEGYVVID